MNRRPACRWPNRAYGGRICSGVTSDFRKQLSPRSRVGRGPRGHPRPCAWVEGPPIKPAPAGLPSPKYWNRMHVELHVKQFVKCELNYIEIQRCPDTISLPGLACIFHLDLFHPVIFDQCAGRSCPQLRPSYLSNYVLGVEFNAQRTLPDRPCSRKTTGPAPGRSFAHRKRKADQLVD